MNRVVVGVGGGIGAGKTAVVRALAEHLRAVTASFGDFVRGQAAARAIEPTRDNLQALGAQLKNHHGDWEFARMVLGDAPIDATVVVDGIRHVEIADMIERIVAPRRFYLVFLDVTDAVRASRTEGDRPEEATRLLALATHSTESQVRDGQLRARADLMVDATAPIAEVVATIAKYISADCLNHPAEDL